MQIILYSDNINLLSYWQKSLEEKNYQSVDEIDDLYKVFESLIVLNYEALGRDFSAVLKHLKENDNKVLVLHRTPDILTAKKVLHAGAMGYGNVFMHKNFFDAALHTLQEEMIWLAPDLTSQLILEIPQENDNKDVYLEKLTSREKEVAQLLKEALTYKVIAEKLNISPRTIKAHAHAIYKKLDVSDRVGLALLLK